MLPPWRGRTPAPALRKQWDLNPKPQAGPAAGSEVQGWGCLHVSECMSVQGCAHTHVYASACMSMYACKPSQDKCVAHICARVHVGLRMCPCLPAGVCVARRTSARMYACVSSNALYLCTGACACMCAHASLHWSVHICLSVHVSVLHICARVYAHLHAWTHLHQVCAHRSGTCTCVSMCTGPCTPLCALHTHPPPHLGRGRKSASPVREQNHASSCRLL